MPSIVVGNQGYRGASFTPKESYDYDYPNGLDLKPGSKLHNSIVTKVMEKAYSSGRTMSTRHKDWRKIDHTLTAYIPVDEEERTLKDADPRKPVSIVFPNSYTVMETLLSYFIGAFLQEPIFKYEGVGPNDVIGAILLEKQIDLQCIHNKVGLNLHTQARDAFAYGFGVSTPTWIQEYGTTTVEKETKGFMGMGKKRELIPMKNQLLFEGNALENIDPYKYLPDVNVPVNEPQKGEYCGWVASTNYMNLIGQERNDDELFNVKYLQQLKGRQSTIFPVDASGRSTKTGLVSDVNQYDNGTSGITLLKMFLKIIPSEWGLSNVDYPEIWYFEIGQDEILLRAREAGHDHGKIPISVMAPDYDGYSVTPLSRIEILYGMQNVLDFLFNSHIKNVRKAINDTLIYDPYQVNSYDLRNPSEGGLVRLRRPAWGKGVKDVIQQLNVTDVTRANVSDSSFIVQWMDRISGADASMQGSLRQGGPERLTGAEFQGTRAGGVTRLERIVKVMGMQGMHDIGLFFAAHNKQLMSSPSYVKLTGDWQEVLLKEFGKGGANTVDRGRLRIDPDQININFNVIVRDGSVPGGNYAQTWVQLFQTLVSTPEVGQQFDLVRIFTHIARNLGAKNVNDFVKRGGNIAPTVMPDDQVAAQVAQGNMIPIGGGQ